ncbi:mitochondrial small ribosomal subunit Rsm22-domain-containing protein [Hygrophoropsis aurantiaca]|uniref:Mitochondrial small ribosomal subunit Rsm22-domain-containing protein n=1 Tax=Hygrophoropsis aurantiaca TaxID=72124 RepID=A0ACB8ARR1_9AGAM|nr:mitochondrial small ribosomal subunit Rsm22-domain-containing protein [Hygrophoropsis aurantiaca]
MLRGACTGLRVLSQTHRLNVSGFSTTAVSASVQPKAPLDLDPSLKALLQDVDISLTTQKPPAPTPPRELEAFATEDAFDDDLFDSEALINEDTSERREQRKSPAARFGSQGIGAVVLPEELQRSVETLIEASDKNLLHADAKRLFHDSNGPETATGWDPSYDVKYRSYRQNTRHFDRDGTAFASVVLPAHYSAIFSVLQHVKHRLGSELRVNKVIDWGTGTGSGLWASLNCFQNEASTHAADEETRLSTSDITSYLGIDKREGLVSIGKRLLNGIKLGSLSTNWQKTFREDDRLPISEGTNVLAMSAFMLSSLPTSLAKKNLVKEIWESGASTIILIDHNTQDGFSSIAEAREYLLRLGRKELNDPDNSEPIRGTYVVAPCPHDGACPILRGAPNRVVCGFSQRLQRPSFVRKTKHAREGHEDIGYSYVVIRRGSRPEPNSGTTVGRIGAVGQEALDRAAATKYPRELRLAGQHEGPLDDAVDAVLPLEAPAVIEGTNASRELEDALRLEAFQWPRLVFPPLKKSGHIILDACTSEGKIMRLTIPKSQGKQPFYDARKSSWGDIFPHAPKNNPQERFQIAADKLEEGKAKSRTADINRKSSKEKSRSSKSYAAISDELKLKGKRKQTRRDKINLDSAHDF